MGRVPRLTRPYVESLGDLVVVPGSPVARAIGATVRQIVEAPDLPLPGDVQAPLPFKHARRVQEAEGRPLLSAYVRRVKGERLWVWYRPRGASRFDLVAVTVTPP